MKNYKTFRRNLCGLELGKEFLDTTTKSKIHKGKKDDKIHYVKISVKEITKGKLQVENICKSLF